MTQQEIETELKSLQQQQELQKKHWLRCGLVAGGIGIGLAIVSTIIAAITAGGPTPPICLILGFTTIPLYVLSWALTSAGRPPASLSFWCRLTWAWSS